MPRSLAVESVLFFNAPGEALELPKKVDLSTCLSLRQQFFIFLPQLTRGSTLTISGKNMAQLDTAGAWLLLTWQKELKEKGIFVSFKDFRPALKDLLDSIEKSWPQQEALLFSVKNPDHFFISLLLRIGNNTLKTWKKACALTAFLGEIVLTLVKLPTSSQRVRLIPFVAQLEQVGIDALPIVGLISFLIGIVLAFQGADQLKRLGAEIYTINLVGISVLREIGILLTAIVVAGRSGSAFTAQIGSMKLNQEVDALETMGMNPLVCLVLPRIFALIVILPLLTFFADMAGLLGGAFMSYVSLNIPFPLFFSRLNLALTPWTFWIGLMKAPVFGFVIGLVGCFEGLAVQGGAESVGRHTTKSVVESIFLVIVVDAFFSVFFTLLGI